MHQAEPHPLPTDRPIEVWLYFHLSKIGHGYFSICLKIFLVDWSQIDDPGKHHENFVACSLLKAVQGWNDLGLGNFSLEFIRTKEKREVDFVVADNNQPWFVVEVKTSETRLSPNLEYFQKMLGAKHAFQATINLPYQDLDCFSIRQPVAVPARTLLSQLL